MKLRSCPHGLARFCFCVQKPLNWRGRIYQALHNNVEVYLSIARAQALESSSEILHLLDHQLELGVKRA